MVRLLLAIVLLIGGSAVVAPADADAATPAWVEQIDPAADEVAIEPVVVHGVARFAALLPPCSLGITPVTASWTRIFRPPRG